MKLAVAVLLLASVSSGQLLFVLRRLGAPPAVLRLPIAEPAPDSPSGDQPDYKQQVQQRNAECYQQCASEFEAAEGAADACERGCRLFALAEASQPKGSTGEHRDKCSRDCVAAYPVPVEQHSCQSGCRHQRPKQQDEEGAPVVMSVMRKFTFDSNGDQDVRRSQSSVLVRDGDKMRIIEGPAQVTVTKHGEDQDLPGPFPRVLDSIVQRMRQMVQHMAGRLDDVSRPQPTEPAVKTRHQPSAEVSSGLRPALSGWRRVWRCTPHYVVLAVLLLVTTLVLYTCYCVVLLVRRRRRNQRSLIQNEEVAADLPPKYSPATDGIDASKAEPPPAYAVIVAASELPSKPDV